MGRKALPLHKVRKIRSVTLSDIEYYPVDFVNRTRELGNESEALRFILDDYAKIKAIEIPPADKITA